MAVMVKATSVIILMNNSLNTFSYLANQTTRHVLSSVLSTVGTEMFGFIIWQVSMFHYTSISSPLFWKVLVEAERH